MATFVHITDARLHGKIRRGGLRAEKAPRQGRGVFCVPVLPNFQITFQWLRELKRSGYRTAAAVQFKIPDDEKVLVGRYGHEPDHASAAEAAAMFQASIDARGLEVFVRRGINPGEIQKIRFIPQIIGWRYYPEAKGRLPMFIPSGSIKGARARNRQQARNRSPLETMNEPE